MEWKKIKRHNLMGEYWVSAWELVCQGSVVARIEHHKSIGRYQVTLMRDCCFSRIRTLRDAKHLAEDSTGAVTYGHTREDIK